MICREATTRDIPQIVELWTEFFDFHKERDIHFSRSAKAPENFANYIGENLGNEEVRVYVAELNGKVVAYLLAMIQNYPPVFERKQYGFISDLAVTSTCRGSGIGSELFDLARDWFSQKEITRVEIEVAITNKPATSFWNKMGFRSYKEVKYLEL